MDREKKRDSTIYLLNHWLWIIFLSLLPFSLSDAITATQHSTAQLLLNYDTITPGDNILAMLHIQTEPGWHVYWKNPGDSGIPPSNKWQLPNDIQAGDQQYLPPQRFSMGPVINFGYSGDAYYFTPITISNNAKKGRHLLSVNSTWLVCQEECIPQHASFTLPLTVANHKQRSRHFDTIAQQYRRRPDGLFATYNTTKEWLLLQLPTLPDHDTIKSVYFFPEQEGLITTNHSQSLVQIGHHYQIIMKRDFATPESPLTGILTLYLKSGKQQPYKINATPAPWLTRAATFKLWSILISAFIGGLLLNIMPCVFPILALKVLAISQNRINTYWSNVFASLLYTAGIMLTFSLVAITLLLLRTLGYAVGWGYQMQSPTTISLLIYLFFILALSFTNYLSLGTSLMHIGERLISRRWHYLNHFFTGVLAVFVASPCTVPFMATAVGFALLQPMTTMITILLMLGLGFATPVLLIACLPYVARWLPKPGRWMEIFKQILAFPLFATVIWLLWILMQQTKHQNILLLMLGLLGITLAIWIAHQLRSWLRWSRYTIIILLLLIACYPIVQIHRSHQQLQQKESGGGHSSDRSTPFSQQALEQAISQHQLVFVNQTAAWCLTCKYNEMAVLNTTSVRQALSHHQVLYLKGDWTHHNANILAYLNTFGRNGVPLYVIYDYNGKPEVLPQLLTKESVINAITRAAATKPKEKEDEGYQ